MKKQSRPWYIWLSVPAAFVLLVLTMKDFMYAQLQNKWDAGLWKTFLKNAAFIWFVLILLPIIVVAIIGSVLSGVLPSSVTQAIVIVVIYGMGVIGADRHAVFRNRHF